MLKWNKVALAIGEPITFILQLAKGLLAMGFDINSGGEYIS